MQFTNSFGTLRDKIRTINDPEDFQMPYDTPSKIDRETMEWKYYRLNNKPSHLYQVKVGNTAYWGGA